MNTTTHDHNSSTSSGLETLYPLTPELNEALNDLLSNARQEHVYLKGGDALRYEVLGCGANVSPAETTQKSQENHPLNHEEYPCLVLANGLGGRLYTWLPLIESLASHMKIITWDYRGLFDSQGVANPNELTIPSHADDLALILSREGVTKAHICGWSMGVQVSLEFTSRYAHIVESLILINGTYGQVFSTAFQPWFRAPMPTWILHEVVETLRRFEGATRLGVKGASLPIDMLFTAYSGLASALLSPLQAQTRKPLLMLAARQYCKDLCTGEHLSAYLTLFQHLDAHSVFHVLPDIDAPTLVISGGVDFLTPPYQSRQITRRMPNAKHHSITFGSHFVLLERSRKVLKLVRRHLEDCGVKI